MEQDPKIPPQADEGAEGETPPSAGEISRAASILESLLLVSSQPLSFERIGQLLGGLSKSEVREVVDALRRKYGADTSGILVEEVAKGLQLRTNPANQEFVRRLFEARPPRFTRPSLETLAVVAYKQPVTRLEIEQIRGVDCAASLKTLMERRLVRVVGKKDVPGRPFLFGTTREFLEVFSLASLSELPSMGEIEDFLGAKTGTPVPEPASVTPFLAAFGGPPGGGEELAAELTESWHGEPLVAIVNELPEGVSDDVLVEAASMAEADLFEMKPLSPSGKGSSQFSFAGEHLDADSAEPLITGSSGLAEVGIDEEPEPEQD